MKRFLLILCALAFGVSLANAQPVTTLCFPTNGSNCQPVTSANPFPVVGSVSITGSIPAGTNTIGNTVPAPTASSTLALTHVACGSAVSSCVLKATPGNLYGVYAECSAACWLMVFNSTTAPSNGATTAGIAASNMVECISVPIHDQRSLNYPVFPIALSTGITAVISSTECATLTLATTGFIHGTVQ